MTRRNARLRLHIQQYEERPPKGAVGHKGGPAEDASFSKVNDSRNELSSAPEADRECQGRPGAPESTLCKPVAIVVKPKPISPTTAGFAHHSFNIPLSANSAILLFSLMRFSGRSDTLCVKPLT